MPSGEPNDGKILRECVEFLVDHGFKLLRSFSDDVGVFAAKFVDPKSMLPFVLTARSIPPWKGIVSFNKGLLDHWKTIHVLAVVLDDDARFYVFSGKRISAFRSETFGNYYQPNHKMINFPFSWGEEWNPGNSLAPIWMKVKRKTPKIQETLF